MKSPHLFFVAALAIAGCGKSDKSNPTPASTIAYQGTVNLVDEFGNSQPDRSLVNVIVTDTSPNWVVYTDASGAYSLRLSAVPAGKHQLSYTYTGGGTYLKSDVPTTDTPLPTVTISRLTTTHVTIVATRSGSNYIIQGSTIERPTATRPRPYRLFFTRSFAPAPSPPIATAYYFTLAGTPAADGSFSVTVTPSDLIAAGFQTGDNVLVYGAGDNPAASTYVDPRTNKTVYPADDLTISNPTLFSFR